MTDREAILELLSLLLLDPRTGVLMALLVVAAVIDWKSSRIPNWLTVGGMLLGLAISTAKGPTLLAGIEHGAGGLALGLLLPLPLYAIRIMGAGDVKLMAMVGAFLGALLTLSAMLFSFMAGGVIAVAWAMSHGVFGRMAANLMFLVTCLVHPAGGGWRAAAPGSFTSVGRLPFGVAISAGTITFLLIRQFT